MKPMKRNLKEQADFVIESIKGLGLNPNPSSRLMKMYKLLNSGIDYFKPDHPEFETLLESLRDFQIFEFIFDYLNGIDIGKEEFTK